MTLDGVSRIETVLGIKVPDAYKALVTNYPPELFQHAADFDLMDDPDRVIAMNREVRSSAFYGVRWPAPYFAIGENGYGDYYCLDVSGQIGGVLFFDHEIRKFEERAPSLDLWWPMIVKDYEES